MLGFRPVSTDPCVTRPHRQNEAAIGLLEILWMREAAKVTSAAVLPECSNDVCFRGWYYRWSTGRRRALTTCFPVHLWPSKAWIECFPGEGCYSWRCCWCCSTNYSSSPTSYSQKLYWLVASCPYWVSLLPPNLTRSIGVSSCVTLWNSTRL